MSTVKERIEAARYEAESIEHNLRSYSGLYNSEDKTWMRERLTRLGRQIAMLTEDQRKPEVRR